MGYNPSKFTSCGGTCPVETVNWHEAVAYCNALSTKAGLTACYSCSNSSTSVTCKETAATTGKGIYTCKGYRLPTEAEWEYAYRAGTTTAFYNGGITSCTGSDPNAGTIGWYISNANSTPHPVGKKTANTWGLYDMAGNDWEWCHDWYQSGLGSTAQIDPLGSGSSARVLRGGSWPGTPFNMRAARRNQEPPTSRYNYYGFRCVRTLPTVTDDTFADFSKGTLSESGAKIYVSAKGNVQMLDRLDLNRDGWLDIVFSQVSDGVTRKANSHIYWGSASGYSSIKRAALPTIGAIYHATADLNDDGQVDLLFANGHDGISGKTNSYIYWGTSSGFSASSKLPTLSTTHVAVADLNADGYLDVVYTNATPGGPSGYVRIYWGSKIAYSANNKTDLPTTSQDALAIADLNKDGRLDLITGAWGSNAKAYLYWGSTTGFSVSKRAELPTYNVMGVAVADLNNDQYLDIIFSNNHDMSNNVSINSFIYWGSATGFSSSNRAELPTHGAMGISAAYVNTDGYLDLVFSNHRVGKSWSTNSFIYCGSASGYSKTACALLPTVGAAGNRVVDLNGDTHVDIIFNNYHDGKSYAPKSYIYWGSASGHSKSNRAELPAIAAARDQHNYGSVYNRKPIQTFTSRVHDTGVATPTYTILAWLASVPKKTSLKFQVRSATNKAGVATAKWFGPKSTTDYYVGTTASVFAPKVSAGSASLNAVHKGHRYVQYQATFEHKFGNTPVLDRVEIRYK